MGTTKREMVQLLRQMGDKKESVEWFRLRNRELLAELGNISTGGQQMGISFGGNNPGDRVGREVANREKWEFELKRNREAIERRLLEYADLARVMTDSLTSDERNILYARHAQRMSWEAVVHICHISRSHCFRLEAVGMEKLCRAWDKFQNEKAKKSP